MGRKKKDKSKDYFGEIEEIAVKEFLCETTSTVRKNELFSKTIEPALRKLIRGILTMPKFQKIIGLYKDFDCEEGAYYHLIFNMHKFDPSKLGKTGEPVRAYSYYGTAVKNYILGLKIQADKQIAKHGGTVDIDEMNEDVKYEKRDLHFFEDLRASIVYILSNIPEDQKFTKNDHVVLSCLKYMLENWHKLEFQDKNQFNRLLISYSQLSQSIVMTSLKKIKTIVSQDSKFNTKMKSDE